MGVGLIISLYSFYLIFKLELIGCTPFRYVIVVDLAHMIGILAFLLGIGIRGGVIVVYLLYLVMVLLMGGYWLYLLERRRKEVCIPVTLEYDTLSYQSNTNRRSLLYLSVLPSIYLPLFSSF